VVCKINQKAVSSVFYAQQQNACFARLSHGLGVCLSLRLSRCHPAVLYQNGASYDYEIFIMGCPKGSSFFRTKFYAPVRGGSPRTSESKRSTLTLKETLFCRYWLL